MPPKQPNQMRTWGTRYDTLPTPSSLSPESTRGEEQLTGQLTEVKDKDDRPPHNASVFIGSLPSNIDQAELTRLLVGHLSEYTEIKSIKVIRDSKGGVCAFVQCEDETSASTFLQCLHSRPPKPFLGRILRYEPARAFRTLLISYRAPSRVTMSERIGKFSPRTKGELPELELPHAIRLWKPKNTKYHRIVYNAEAIEAEQYARTLPKDDAISGKETAVCLHPLKFDAESMIKLVRYFGSLEKVSTLTENHDLVKVPEGSNFTPECYPPPHNMPRSKGMDTGCWEVKWNHRDDCVTALMTLCRVPHLSVSWAHRPKVQRVEPRYHMQRYQQALDRALRTQPRIDRFQPYFSPSFVPPLEPTSPHSNTLGARPEPLPEDNSRTIPKHGSISDDESKYWMDPVTPPGFGHKLGHKLPSTFDAPLPEEGDRRLDPLIATKIDWGDTDFPSFIDSECNSKLDWSIWSGTTHFEKDIGPPSIVASQSVHGILTPQKTRASPLIQAEEISTPGLATSPPTPGTTLSQTPATPIHQIYGSLPSGYETKIDARETSDGSLRPAKEFDPTSLFVGGLEMYGPGAWTDEKVRVFFGRFEGLEFVRVVRPPNGNAAFAFVKYNNTESPARAILEEHNHIYAGRALKVQLRDINPPRSTWRRNRGRGRYSHYHPSRKTVFSRGPIGNSHDREATLALQRDSNAVEINKTVLEDTVPVIEAEGTHHKTRPTNKQQPESPMARVLEHSREEKYREWYDTPVAESPPDSSGSSGSVAPPPATSMVSVPCPVPGYYPMPWFHPYAPPGPNQLSYYAPYPSYPIPAAPTQPFPTMPPGSGVNGSTTASHSWPGMMYNAYFPYFGPPTVEHNPSASVQAPQAPLVPSGFIQNDRGTLIAVYPSEALDQYMADQGMSNNGNGCSNLSTSTQSISTTSTWSSTQTLPLPGSASSHNIGSQANSVPPRLCPVPTNLFWNPVPPPYVHVPPGLVTNPAMPRYSLNPTPRPGENQNRGSANSPSSNLGRKEANGRDFHRQNVSCSTRASIARNGRSPIRNENLTGDAEGVNSPEGNCKRP